MLHVGEVVVNAELCSNTEVHLQLPKYMWFMVVSKPYWLLLKAFEQDMNITCSNWLLLKVPEQAYDEHHHCKSYWWLLKLPECVVSTFVLATLEQLLWDFF
jgi:hypothetical protein